MSVTDARIEPDPLLDGLRAYSVGAGSAAAGLAVGSPAAGSAAGSLFFFSARFSFLVCAFE